MIVDQLANALGISIAKKQTRSLLAIHKQDSARIILAKPQTFMNESGRAVQSILSHFKISPERMMVIFDDLDLPLGTIRIRPSGGTGGHNGMRSIQAKINTQEYPRMRVGIGRPPGRMDPADYVLQDFSDEQLELLELTTKRAVECLVSYLEDGIEEAMTNCNAAIQLP